MSEISLIKGEFEEKLKLMIAPQIMAGFPSPAEDYLHESIDFNRDLIKHPEATFDDAYNALMVKNKNGVNVEFRAYNSGIADTLFQNPSSSSMLI